MESAATMATAATAQVTQAVVEEGGSYYWFLFVTVLFGILWYFMTAAVNIVEISTNWPKHRCDPAVMPFASAYGYNTSENFNYCLTQVFQGQVGGVTGPVTGIMGTMTTNMMGFLQNLNSLRVMLATLVGSVSKMAQEFVNRFRLATMQVKVSSLKIQQMMKRLFATFYAVIYMGLSAVTTGINFTDTFIFKFLDTFCFPPETEILLENNTKLPIAAVKLGDVLENGARVTSTYRFMSEGQSMVWMDKIQVSTNHLVLLNNRWIPAEEHPEAWPAQHWRGGVERPLICLDTDIHHIPIGGYMFRDWDETDESDEATMVLAEQYLNGGSVDTTAQRPWKYQPAIEGPATIVMKDGSTKAVENLVLGDQVSTGTVTGIGKRHVTCVLKTEQGTLVTPSQLVWNAAQNRWVRAGHGSTAPFLKVLEEPAVFYTLLISNSATYELATGEVLRDMLEVHNPDMEAPTTAAMAVNNPKTT